MNNTVEFIEFDWGNIPNSDNGVWWWFTVGLRYRKGVEEDRDVYWVVSMN